MASFEESVYSKTDIKTAKAITIYVMHLHERGVITLNNDADQDLHENKVFSDPDQLAIAKAYYQGLIDKRS